MRIQRNLKSLNHDKRKTCDKKILPSLCHDLCEAKSFSYIELRHRKGCIKLSGHDKGLRILGINTPIKSSNCPENEVDAIRD